MESNLQATEKGKEYHDRKAKPHTYCVGQKVLLEEYYFLGKNTKLAPKWSGPHVILFLKGTHNIELLIQGQKKVIVNVDRIKPYRIPDVPSGPEAGPEDKVRVPPIPNAVYEFDGEKFVPRQDSAGTKLEAEPPTRIMPNDSVEMPANEPNQIPAETMKQGRPRKLDPGPLKIPSKKNKWNMETPLPSTSRMVTRSRAQEVPKETVSAINTSIPCFCGNQRLLKTHSTNC
jgi:hypothetical protein